MTIKEAVIFCLGQSAESKEVEKATTGKAFHLQSYADLSITEAFCQLLTVQQGGGKTAKNSEGKAKFSFPPTQYIETRILMSNGTHFV